MAYTGRSPSFAVLTTDDIAANTIYESDLNYRLYQANSHVYVPSGNTASRPVSPSIGYFRYNLTDGTAEIYNGTAWGSVGGSATGGGSDAVFIENDQTVTTNYTIPATKNAMSTGPVTINSGVTVTVSSGARYVVI